MSGLNAERDKCYFIHISDWTCELVMTWTELKFTVTTKNVVNEGRELKNFEMTQF